MSVIQITDKTDQAHSDVSSVIQITDSIIHAHENDVGSSSDLLTVIQITDSIVQAQENGAKPVRLTVVARETGWG